MHSQSYQVYKLLSNAKLFNNGLSPLFRISANNNTSYLFGSCHPIKLDYLRDNDHIYNTLLNQKTLITECGRGIFARLNLEKIFEKLDKSDFYENLQLISDHTNGILNDTNTFRAKNKYMPSIMNLFKDDPIYNAIKNVDTMKFNYIAQNIYCAMCISGIDTKLIYHYSQKINPILALDSFGYLAKLYLEYYIRFSIFGTLMISKCTNKSFFSVIDSVLFDYLNKELILDNKSPNFMERMFSQVYSKRNIKWIPKIKKFHNEMEDPLFVFGIGHLNGKYGIVRLLLNDGYKIEQYHVGYNEYIRCI